MLKRTLKEAVTIGVNLHIGGNLVGGTGFEPVTSSVSRKRSTPEPTAHIAD